MNGIHMRLRRMARRCIMARLAVIDFHSGRFLTKSY